MSYVLAAPEFVTSAATDLAGIGSSLSEADAAAGASTTSVITAAEDEVSAAVATLFSGPWSGLSGRQCSGGGVLLSPGGVRYWPQIEQELGA